jgi:hypothetical protein
MRRSSPPPFGAGERCPPAHLAARKCKWSPNLEGGFVPARLTGPVALEGRLRSERPPTSVGGRRTWKPLREVRPQVRPGRDGCREGSGRPSPTGTPVDGPRTGWALSRHRPGNGSSRSRNPPGTVRRRGRGRRGVRKAASASRPTGRIRSTPRNSADGAARGSPVEGLPAAVPADRPCRPATDGKRRLPVRRLRQGRPLSRKRSARRLRRPKGSPGGVPRLRCPPSRAGWRRSRAPDLQVRLPSRVCQVGVPWVAIRLRGGSPPRGCVSALLGRRMPSGGLAPIRTFLPPSWWGDPEPRKGPDPRGPAPAGPARGIGG